MVRQVPVTASNTPVPHTKIKRLSDRQESASGDFGNDSQFLDFLNEHMTSFNINETIPPGDDLHAVMSQGDRHQIVQENHLEVPYQLDRKIGHSISQSSRTSASLFDDALALAHEKSHNMSHNVSKIAVEKQKVVHPTKRPVTIPKPFTFHGSIKPVNNADVSSSRVPVALATKSRSLGADTKREIKPVKNQVVKKELTRPISPKLSTSNRGSNRSSHLSIKPTESRASSLSVSTSKSLIPESINRSKTVPKPFVFHTTGRTKKPSVIPKVEETYTSTVIKPTPLPKYLIERRIPSTPFDRNRSNNNENNILNKSASRPDLASKSRTSSTLQPTNYAFHAQPIRTQLGKIPSVPSRPLTVPKPFQLGPVSRDSHTIHDTDSISNSVDSNHCFKAKPVPHGVPFIPKRSTKPLTLLPDDLHLSTEQRASDRETFEKKLKEKQNLMELMKERQLKERERLERLEIAKLRVSTVHHALPMPKFGTPVRNHQ